MRVAAILRPNTSEKEVDPFRADGLGIVRADLVTAGLDAALVFGGDGSVHRQLVPLVETGVPLLPVPAGSGNDFAAALGIRSRDDALRAFRRFLAGERNLWDVDLGVIERVGGGNGSQPEPEGRGGREARVAYFCCVGGAGLDADANRRANAMPAWMRRRGGYVLAALSSFARFRPRVMAAEMDGGGPRGLAWAVIFANAPSYGDGMRIAPRARLDDGRLDLVFVHAFARRRLFRFFHTVFSGNHLWLPEVAYCKTGELRVESDVPTDVYADGEFVCRTPVRVRVASRALRVIVPQVPEPVNEYLYGS